MAKRASKVKAADEAAYYEEALSWEADRVRASEKSERRAWMASGGMAVITTAAVIAVAAMAPLKRAVPYVFAVDKATGNVEVVTAGDDRVFRSYHELTEKNLARRYVIARESYNWTLLQTDYDDVLRFSSDEVGREFAKLYQGSDARDKKYGPGIEFRVKVLSITLAQDAVSTKAVVRFEKTQRRTESDQSEPPQYFVATIGFEFKPSMIGKEEVLIQNPQGYHVLSYRVDAEAATPTPMKPSAAIAAAQ